MEATDGTLILGRVREHPDGRATLEPLDAPIVRVGEALDLAQDALASCAGLTAKQRQEAQRHLAAAFTVATRAKRGRQVPA